MEIRVLRYFLIVAREGNITKASQLLHITQPTLSRQLMQLEEELGIKLFKRNRHNITLTEEGLLLRRRAQEIVSLADKTIDGFLVKQEELRGEISIGAGEFLSIDYLCDVMNKFHNKNPGIHYDINSDNTEEIEEKIDKGILDFGILTETVDISKYDYIHLPQKEVWGILCKKDSELGKKDSIQISDLENLPLIIPKRIKQNLNIDSWFENKLDLFEVVGTYNLLYNAARMVSYGIGIALCIQIKSSYEDLCFVPLDPTIDARTIFIWKKNQVLSPVMSSFIEFIKEYK